MSRFLIALDRGWNRPVRFKPGEGVNVWGNKVNDCADRLDAMADKIPPEVAAILVELFEEIGQQAVDAFAAMEAKR